MPEFEVPEKEILLFSNDIAIPDLGQSINLNLHKQMPLDMAKGPSRKAAGFGSHKRSVSDGVEHFTKFNDAQKKQGTTTLIQEYFPFEPAISSSKRFQASGQSSEFQETLNSARIYLGQ